MNGAFNNNGFVWGLVLTRDRPQEERIPVALAAAQMRPGSALLGLAALKQVVDGCAAAEQRRVAAEQAVQELRSDIEFDLPAGSDTVKLGIHDATGETFRKKGGSPNATVDDGGTVRLPADGDFITVEVALKGVTRSVEVRRQTPPEEGTERDVVARRGQASARERLVDDGSLRATQTSARPADASSGIATQAAAGSADVAQEAGEFSGMSAGDQSSRRRGK